MGLLDSLLGSVLGGGDKNQMIIKLVTDLVLNHGSGQGLNGMLQQFQQAGHGDAVASWVGTGPNQEISGDQVHQALGPDTIQKFAQQTGLGGPAVSALLAQILPQVVNQLTPQGQVPQHAEVQSGLGGLLKGLLGG